jgi:hypothetical protein
MSNLIELNEDIFSILREYLSNKEFNNLINTNREIKKECKGLRCINLNKKYSVKYYYSGKFRDKVLLLIEKSNKQLSLELSNKVDFVDLEDIEYIENIKKVHGLNLSNTNINDVSIFSKVHTLSLNNCKNVSDVSALGGVHSLNLSNTNISDVSIFSKVHTLSLNNCKNVSDVSALGGVHTLNLRNTNVSDVSALAGVHILDLRCCWKVRDVSALNGVYKLNLCGCNNVDDGRVYNGCLYFGTSLLRECNRCKLSW